MDTIDLICPKCHVALMILHPEQPHRFEKCPICGYCRDVCERSGGSKAGIYDAEHSFLTPRPKRKTSKN